MKLFKKAVSAALIASVITSTTAFAAVNTPTVKDELAAGLEPMGKCLYIYGGGWNKEDTGAGIEAVSKGLSPQWEKFYNENTSGYNYALTKYQIHDGLDCTGYLGWIMYQIFGNKYSDSGYVFKSSTVAENYSSLFGSTVIPREQVKTRKSGDIMATEGHVYIVVGQCDDGSVVVMHSSPPNVSLAGTVDKNGNRNSQAVSLAKEYMEKYFPESTNKYKNYVRDNISYLKNFDEIVWNDVVLSDPDNYRNMNAEEVLKDLFENTKVYIDNRRTDINSFAQNNSVYLSLRDLCVNFGAEIDWNSETKTAKVSLNNNVSDISESGKIVCDKKEISEISVFKNQKIYIPLSAVESIFGTNKEYKPETKSVYITSPNPIDGGNYTDEMKIPYTVNVDKLFGADAVERTGDHKDSPYFSRLDYYNMESNDTLTILHNFKTQQQTSEWSCGPSVALMIMNWYGMLGDNNEETLSAYRDNGLTPEGTSLRQEIQMFEGVGGFDIFSTYDCKENVSEVFTPDFIIKTLKEGKPIAIGWNDFGGHWQAIIGYDTMGTENFLDDVIIVADPYDATDHNQDGYGTYSAARFLYNFTYYNYFDESNGDLNDMCFIVASPEK